MIHGQTQAPTRAPRIGIRTDNRRRLLRGRLVPLNYLSASNGPHVCFLAGFSGTLEDDPTAGLVFDTQYGDRIPVLWQPGWTARKSGSVIEVIDSWGTVFARTGGSFSPNGGVDSHGNWDMCELTPLSPAG